MSATLNNNITRVFVADKEILLTMSFLEDGASIESDNITANISLNTDPCMLNVNFEKHENLQCCNLQYIPENDRGKWSSLESKKSLLHHFFKEKCTCPIIFFANMFLPHHFF